MNKIGQRIKNVSQGHRRCLLKLKPSSSGRPTATTDMFCGVCLNFLKHWNSFPFQLIRDKLTLTLNSLSGCYGTFLFRGSDRGAL